MAKEHFQQEYLSPNANRTVTINGFGKLVARRRVAEVACSVVGHHYLKGAKGARPNLKDGAECRKGNVTLGKDPSLKTLAWYAAVAEFDNTPKVPDGAPKPPKETVLCVCGGNYSLAGQGNIFTPGADLDAYLKDQKPSDPGRCYSRAGLTPRRVKGGGDGDPYVWGRSCDGWRHFDCLGLVDFALWKFRSSEDLNTRSVAQWATSAEGSKRMAADDPPLDGDLVAVGTHHIGMIYLKGEKAFVVQAKQTSEGVNAVDAYNPGSWTGGRWRLPDSIFLDDDAAAGVAMPDTSITPIGMLYAK